MQESRQRCVGESVPRYDSHTQEQGVRHLVPSQNAPWQVLEMASLKNVEKSPRLDHRLKMQVSRRCSTQQVPQNALIHQHHCERQQQVVKIARHAHPSIGIFPCALASTA